MTRILVLGAGFAGLWSAVGAASVLDAFQIGRDTVGVTLVNRDAWHAIRVRNYEPDLRGVRVALDDVLEPIGVERVEGEVLAIDFVNRQVACSIGEARHLLAYDRLIIGEQVPRFPDGAGNLPIDEVDSQDLALDPFDPDRFEHIIERNPDAAQIGLVISHTDRVPGIAIDQGHPDRVPADLERVEHAGGTYRAPQTGESGTEDKNTRHRFLRAKLLDLWAKISAQRAKVTKTPVAASSG